MKRYTPEKIIALESNQVFVFGSNLAGRHGAGAALQAYQKFGAEWGVGEGLTGRCYALPTKDRQIESLPLSEIQVAVGTFAHAAMENPDKEFLVTKIGCGLAGFTVEEIAPLFRPVRHLENVVLPKEFTSWNVDDPIPDPLLDLSPDELRQMVRDLKDAVARLERRLPKPWEGSIDTASGAYTEWEKQNANCM